MTGTSLELAPQAWSLAQRIVNTDFVPSSFRGRPEAVLAAMLTGHELGIGPMQSLSKIHVIDGRPAMAAELMRALVLGAGHELWVEESSNTKCVIVGRRRGSDRETRITWTMDDAKRAGLEGRQNWRKYPRAMLLARATSELMRLAFADVIGGISYSVEELTDGEQVDEQDTTVAEPPAPAGKKARARRAVTAQPEPIAEPPVADSRPAIDVPLLPGEEDAALRERAAAISRDLFALTAETVVEFETWSAERGLSEPWSEEDCNAIEEWIQEHSV